MRLEQRWKSALARVWISGALIVTGASLLATSAQAELVLPRPSPSAKVMQTVGVTDIEVAYSSPGVKGRKVFGDVVQFDEVWRTGANMATTITFSTDAKVAGQSVPAGTYAIFTIPGKRNWTLILNKNAEQSGTRGYDKALDQVRFEAKPEKIAARERLAFIFSNTTDNSTRLDLEWAELRVSFPIEVDTAALAMANVTAATSEGWRDYAAAARYMLDTNGDAKQGVAFADMALAIEDGWMTNYIKAQLLAKLGDYSAAHALAEKAYEQGKKADYFFWEKQVEQAIKDYAAKK